MIRRWLPWAVACSAAAIAAAAVAPALAAQDAAASPIVIDAISSPPDESGLLSIQMEAPTAISITAVNFDSGGTLEYSLLGSEFTLTPGSGSAQDGVWALSSPIPQNALRYGTYTVTVTATDSGGDSISNEAAPGSFFFGLDPSLTLSASNSTLSYSQQSVTFSGQETAYDPDGNVVVVPGQTVSVEGQDGSSYTATTNLSGSYSLTESPAVYSAPGRTESYTASVAATSTAQAASSGSVTLAAQLDPVQVSVSLSKARVKFGAKVTLHGKAQQESGGVWLPLAHAPIDVTGSDFYSGRKVGPITATTNARGLFSVVLPARPTTTWTASAGPSPWLSDADQSTATLPDSALLTVSLPTRVPSLSLRYNSAGHLTASGCLDLSPAVTSFPDLDPPPDTPLSLQYSASKNGPWHTLGALGGASSRACSHGTGFKKVYDSAPLSAYFRVRFGGQLFYQPSVSRAVHDSIARTRFAGFSISPRSVSRNGRITLSGELQHKTAHGWSGLADARITIGIEPSPGDAWYWYKKLRVSKSGKFSVSFADPVSAHWDVAYAGDTADLHSQSGVIYVQAGRG